MIHGVIQGVGFSGISISRLCRTLNLDCTDDMMQSSETKTDLEEGGCGGRCCHYLFRNKDELKALFLQQKAELFKRRRDVRGLEERDAWALGDCDIY